MFGRTLRQPPPPGSAGLPGWLARRLLPTVASIAPAPAAAGRLLPPTRLTPCPRRHFSFNAAEPSSDDMESLLFSPPPAGFDDPLWDGLPAPTQGRGRGHSNSQRKQGPADHEPMWEASEAGRASMDSLGSIDDHPLMMQSDALNQALSGIHQETQEARFGPGRKAQLYRRGQLQQTGVREAEARAAEKNRAALLSALPEDPELMLFTPEASELLPVFAPQPRSAHQKMRDKRSLMTPKHAQLVTQRKEERLKTNPKPGPILDMEGRVMDSGRWLVQIKTVTDPRIFVEEVKKARACNWFTEANVMGAALLHALRSQFPLRAVLEPLEGLIKPSAWVLTSALSVAISGNHHRRILEVLLELGAVVDGGSNTVPRPLHQALISRREDLVDWLVEQGARTDLPCLLTNRSTLEVALMAGMGHCVPQMGLQVPERVIQSKALLRELITRNLDTSLRFMINHKADIMQAFAPVPKAEGDAASAEADAEPAQPNDPMVLAASLDHVEVIQVMIESGMSVFDPVQSPMVTSGREPAYSSAFAMAVRRGQLRAVRFLLSVGADLNARHPETGSTPLMEAAEVGQSALVDQLLSIHADPYIWDYDHRNALSIAVVEDHFPVVQVMFAHKFDLNTADPLYGVTPLMLSVLHNREYLTHALLAHKADPHRLSKNGQTALSAAMQTNAYHLVRALLEAGGDINTRDHAGNSLLYHLIVRGDQLALLDYLLARRPSPHVCLSDPRISPINLAVEAGHKGVVQLLIQHGYMPSTAASAAARVPGVEEQHTWPLALAIQRGNLSLAALLMRNYCAVGAADPDGNTALHFALRVPNPDTQLIQALFRQGANPFLPNRNGERPWDLAPTPELRRLLVELNTRRPEALWCLAPDDVVS